MQPLHQYDTDTESLNLLQFMLQGFIRFSEVTEFQVYFNSMSKYALN